jgi:hypothetical protein
VDGAQLCSAACLGAWNLRVPCFGVEYSADALNWRPFTRMGLARVTWETAREMAKAMSEQLNTPPHWRVADVNTGIAVLKFSRGGA